MTNRKNDERTVRCPVEGCDATPLARGINLHINRSSGSGHGSRGEVPDNISLDNLETVGEREVEMDYPEERNNEKHARLCTYCNQTFSGEQGLMIHLGQTAGRKNHPPNPTDRHDPEDFPRVKVDAEGNVRQVTNSSDKTATDPTGNEIPVTHVFSLIAELVADGEIETAHRVRRDLIGVDDVTRPIRDIPPYQELYEALLSHSGTGTNTDDLSATVEKEGIMIVCNGESALCSGDEARDIAAGLERRLPENPSDDQSGGLIEFLRYGANLLDDEQTARSLHIEYERWR